MNQSLFSRSISLTGQIYIFCVVEWAIYFGAVFGLNYLAVTHLHEVAYDFFLPIFAPMLVPLTMAMSLSQMRTGLLRLHETGSIDFAKISRYVYALLRFIGVMTPLVFLCLAALVALMYSQGLFTKNELMFIYETVKNQEPGLALVLFNNGPRMVYLGVMVLIMMLASSFIMIPMAASATAAGEGSNHYDPFYGFGRQAIPLLSVTILVLALTAGMLYAGLLGFRALFAMFMEANNGTLPPFEESLLTYGPLVYAFLVIVWTSTIWFSSAVLAFIDHRHVVAEAQYQRHLDLMDHADRAVQERMAKLGHVAR